MRIYEKPIIGVTMFNAEDIVTTSTPDPASKTAVEQAKAAAMSIDATGGNTITVTF